MRRKRRELRLKQEEVATLAAVGPVFLYDLEHGKPTLRIDKVLDVLRVLGLELQLRTGKHALTIASDLT